MRFLLSRPRPTPVPRSPGRTGRSALWDSEVGTDRIEQCSLFLDVFRLIIQKLVVFLVTHSPVSRSLATLRRPGAHLTRAHLTRARLDGAVLDGAVLAGADLTGVRWPVRVQVPDGWMVDSDSGWLKRAGQLSEVMTHYL